MKIDAFNKISLKTMGKVLSRKQSESLKISNKLKLKLWNS
jgi:hypothetical protein